MTDRVEPRLFADEDIWGQAYRDYQGHARIHQQRRKGRGPQSADSSPPADEDEESTRTKLFARLQDLYKRLVQSRGRRAQDSVASLTSALLRGEGGVLTPAEDYLLRYAGGYKLVRDFCREQTADGLPRAAVTEKRNTQGERILVDTAQLTLEDWQDVWHRRLVAAEGDMARVMTEMESVHGRLGKVPRAIVDRLRKLGQAIPEHWIIVDV